MIHYTIYKENTGEIVFTGIAVKEDEIKNMAAEGQSYLLEASKENQLVDNGTVADMPPKPDGEYIFNYTSKTWVFNEPVATEKALYQRDQLLKNGPDRISPLWFSAMTDEQKKIWADYRQALLDITKQTGFPMNIVWPQMPGQTA